ncbi:hypothetical protein V494_00712 [Pseudogymnoascus sp. VKM F-4513 (FW-928)]|nr:hypothetical protein V494_00712 [Pseudogymnoascus sp. VKM F-4513 (FW-928)]
MCVQAAPLPSLGGLARIEGELQGRMQTCGLDEGAPEAGGVGVVTAGELKHCRRGLFGFAQHGEETAHVEVVWFYGGFVGEDPELDAVGVGDFGDGGGGPEARGPEGGECNRAGGGAEGEIDGGGARGGGDAGLAGCAAAAEAGGVGLEGGGGEGRVEEVVFIAGFLVGGFGGEVGEGYLDLSV